MSTSQNPIKIVLDPRQSHHVLPNIVELIACTMWTFRAILGKISMKEEIDPDKECLGSSKHSDRDVKYIRGAKSEQLLCLTCHFCHECAPCSGRLLETSQRPHAARGLRRQHRPISDSDTANNQLADSDDAAKQLTDEQPATDPLADF